MRPSIYLAVTLVAVTAALFAQEYRGTFSGNVTDSQGAAVPGAKVTATEIRTGSKTAAISEGTGAYAFPFLAPGEYEITAESSGFKRFVRKGLTLSAGEKPVIDIHLEVGAISDSVTVTEETPLVVAATASIGEVVTTQEVEDIPVNGRAPIMLMGLSMGVLTLNEPGPTRPFDGPGSNFMLGGVTGNEFLMNGAPNANSTAGGASAYSPPQDAVTEVVSNAFESDAAYGHTGGGVANLITKSGTNAFHGSAYEFNQSSAMDANSFFANKAGTPRPAYHYNQYGLTAGGPVWIPKLFNGKNRVFWFFGYEGLRDSDPASSPLETTTPIFTTTVPTPAERQGDFSALLKLNTGNTSYAIYNPYTGVASGTQVMRTPFPNNVIPANMLNPVAVNYMKLFPQPNAPGLANGFQNFVTNAIDTDVYDNEMGRMDFNLSDKNRLSFDARHSYRYQKKDDFFGNPATGYYLARINQGASLDDVYTIAPTLVSDVRVNWTRFVTVGGGNSDGFDPSTLGFPSYLGAGGKAVRMPPIVFTSSGIAAGSPASFQNFGSNQSGSVSPVDSFQFFGDIVKIRGNHSLKAGVDLREYRASAAPSGNQTGTFAFNTSSANFAPSTGQISQTWTNGPLNNAVPAPLGQDLAAFLLGLPSSGSIDVNAQTTTSERYYAMFLQDDWRARPNLTVNVGLRWEHETPTSERYGRSVNGFDPTAANPIALAAAAAYNANPIAQLPAGQFKALGGLTFASPGSPNIYHSNSQMFSPRFGIAWSPTVLGTKTVIRAGFGVFVSPNGATGLNSPGYSQTTQFVATNNNYLSPANTLSDPFSSGILPPAGSSAGAGTFLGQQVTFFNPEARNAYSMRWNVGIQRALPGQMVVEVAYIGNHALHIPITTQLDSIPRQYLSTSPVRDTAVINLLSSNVTNPFKGLLPNSTALNGTTVPLNQLLIPFPQFPVGSGTGNGVVMQGNFVGSSYYHSLNVRLQKRLTHGLTIINNIIWSQLIERTAYLNDSDPAPEKRISNSSRPFHESLGASYELPIGRGKHVNLQSRLGNSLIGGWAINGRMTLQTGPPLSWGNVIYYGGGLNLKPHTPDGPAFDVTRFNTISSQQLANNIRTFDTNFNNLRRDPTRNLDMSVLKRFALGERRYFQLRFEGFNVTNRVTFSAPNLTPTASTFGQITGQANTPRRLQVGGRLVW